MISSLVTSVWCARELKGLLFFIPQTVNLLQLYKINNISVYFCIIYSLINASSSEMWTAHMWQSAADQSNQENDEKNEVCISQIPFTIQINTDWAQWAVYRKHTW